MRAWSKPADLSGDSDLEGSVEAVELHIGPRRLDQAFFEVTEVSLGLVKASQACQNFMGLSHRLQTSYFMFSVLLKAFNLEE